jgi:2,3-bisphosphoglycerate-independent phosphoglycerate mutase
LVNGFVEQARHLLAGKHPANMILLRGFAKLPAVPQYSDIFGLHAAAIAIHGMYRGVAKLVGMQVLEVGGNMLANEFTTLGNIGTILIFYLHVKNRTCGENGDTGRSGRLKGGRLAAACWRHAGCGHHQRRSLITGGTQSRYWHPVPTLLYARHVRADGIAEFGERACARGSLGVLPAKHILLIALANAGRITKYGA